MKDLEGQTSEIIIYNTDDGNANVKLYSKDGVIWMNQQQMALLFDTSKQNISLHILNILQENELEESSVVKDYLTTASDGKNYNVTYYALPIIELYLSNFWGALLLTACRLRSFVMLIYIAISFNILLLCFLKSKASLTLSPISVISFSDGI